MQIRAELAAALIPKILRRVVQHIDEYCFRAVIREEDFFAIAGVAALPPLLLRLRRLSKRPADCLSQSEIPAHSIRDVEHRSRRQLQNQEDGHTYWRLAARYETKKANEMAIRMPPSRRSTAGADIRKFNGKVAIRESR